MGKKTLAKAHCLCLLELIEKAPVTIRRAFSGLPARQALAGVFGWL